MAFVVMELNPFLWEKDIRAQWLFALFGFEIMTALYPFYKK
jgi:hypothetical protein